MGAPEIYSLSRFLGLRTVVLTKHRLHVYVLGFLQNRGRNIQDCTGFQGLELDIEDGQRRRVRHFIVFLSLQLKDCHRCVAFMQNDYRRDILPEVQPRVIFA